MCTYASSAQKRASSDDPGWADRRCRSAGRRRMRGLDRSENIARGPRGVRYGLVRAAQACSGAAHNHDDLFSFTVRGQPLFDPPGSCIRFRVHEPPGGRIGCRGSRCGRARRGVGLAGAPRRRRAARRRDEDGERPREQSAFPRHGHRAPQPERLREGELHGLDHPGKDVRQHDRAAPTGAQRGAGHPVARARHRGVDGRHSAHGRRREATLLDPRGARL